MLLLWLVLEADEEPVAFVFGKFLCNSASAASFFLCFSKSSRVGCATSGLVERSGEGVRNPLVTP